MNMTKQWGQLASYVTNVSERKWFININGGYDSAMDQIGVIFNQRFRQKIVYKGI